MGSRPVLWLTLAAGLSGREGRLVSRSCSPSPASSVSQFKLSVVSLPSARAPHRQHLSGPFWLRFPFHILDRLRRARHSRFPCSGCSAHHGSHGPVPTRQVPLLPFPRGEGRLGKWRVASCHPTVSPPLVNTYSGPGSSLWCLNSRTRCKGH